MDTTGRQSTERRLVAILAADIAGYSRLIGQDEEGTLNRIRSIRNEIIDPAIAAHRGRLVKTTGDGLLVEFASVVNAVRCAVDIQHQMADRSAAVLPDQRLEYRIGIHQGDVVVEDGDIFGDGVNVAARLEGLADPGGICVSARVQEDAAGRLDLTFEDIGEQQLKNIARPVRMFRVRPAGVGPPMLGVAASARGTEPPPLPDKPSIAVLPFQNLSGDTEQEYFADGTVEEIITALSRIRWLFVIARNSSFAYKSQGIDVKRVGRELGVRYVLEGSVRKSGNRVRITAQLIEAESGNHVWAERYDRELTDLFAVQDEIAENVAAVIEPTLAEAEQQRVLRKPLENLDAWEAYQRGLWHFYKYGADENKTAQQYFCQAIDLDPNFAPGHYGYSLAQFFDFWMYSRRPLSEVAGNALEEARTAVSLDDRDAMAHAVLSFVWLISGDWVAAIADGRIAIALNPNSPWSMGMLGTALGWGGYRADGIEWMRRTLRVSPRDPLSWAWFFWMGMFQYFERDLTAAIVSMTEVTRLRPRFGSAHHAIAACLTFLGRDDEAKRVIQNARAQISGHLSRFHGTRAPWQRPDDFAFLEQGRCMVAEIEKQLAE